MDTTIEDVNGVEMKAFDIFTAAIKYLKEQMLAQLQRSLITRYLLTYTDKSLKIRYIIIKYMSVTRLTAGTAHPSGAPKFILSFQWGSCYMIFDIMLLLIIN
jgi:hypothetical protein